MMKVKMRVLCLFLSLICVIRTEEQLAVTGADVPVFAYLGEDVILNCSVDTHVPLGELEVEWIKTNEEIQVLLFMEGRYRAESQPERFRGRAEFFSEEIPKGNFSLKLRDVKTEDRGEFMCRVHTDRKSVNATAWLQKQGFPSSHVCVLGFTMAAAVFAVVSSIPAVCCIKKAQKEKRKEVKSKGVVLLYHLQVSIPCILLTIAFAIWGKIESSVGEAYVCSIIHFVRILVIFKVAPYVLPGTRYERLTNMALPLESFLIIIGINSGFMHSSGYEYQSILLQLEILFLLFTLSTFGFTAVFLLWMMIPSVRRTLSFWQSDLNRKKYGYFIEKVIEVLKDILRSIFYLLFLHILLEKDKQQRALVCLVAFLSILNAVVRFNHRINLPDIAHILVYVFGSAVLSVLNSVALATEVFLKAGVQDKKITEQLSQLFQSCKKQLRCPASSQQNQEAVEVDPLSPPEQSTAHRQETPQEAEETVPLSPSAENITHTGVL
ncbi:uncharacterized protein LOC133140657 [Conger conger]|uniref:uncharacterized protein LOC133140657 n=1 Tax=Conger conger TaxID=82655 RepID=UPI002A5A6C65|nr:uncharacterized protein LOC133140657 [Conger conger]